MLGIIGGSGLYGLELEDEAVFDKFDYKRFGRPSALPRVGTLNGRRIGWLPRHGVEHTVHPHNVNYEGNMFALKAAGCKLILDVGAVGSLTEFYEPGHLVLPHQFRNRSSRITSLYKHEGQPVVHVSAANLIYARFVELMSAELVKLGHLHWVRGEYTCIDGPQFSTKADSIENASDEAGVVGMTMMHEAKIARELEIGFAGVCLVTDYDSWYEGDEVCSTEQILKTISTGLGKVVDLIKAIVTNPELDDIMNNQPTEITQAAATACMTKGAKRDEQGLWIRS